MLSPSLGYKTLRAPWMTATKVTYIPNHTSTESWMLSQRTVPLPQAGSAMLAQALNHSFLIFKADIETLILQSWSL